jgi:hypothetical protein
MIEPYHYVRFKWWEGIDLKKVSEDLGRSFSVKMYIRPRDNLEFIFEKDERDELKVSSDTLSAMLSRSRAVLYQKEVAPFTARDMELREKVLELYPRNTPTPFPWSFSYEPKFEIAK